MGFHVGFGSSNAGRKEATLSGQEKAHKALFVAKDGPFVTPFFNPKIPPKKFLQVPFWRSFPGNEAHKLFFSGGLGFGVLEWGPKVHVEKVYCSSLSPILDWPCAPRPKQESHEHR